MKWLRVHTKLLKNMNEKNGLKLVHIFLTKFKNEVEEQIWIENKNVRPETIEIFKKQVKQRSKAKANNAIEIFTICLQWPLNASKAERVYNLEL